MNQEQRKFLISKVEQGAKDEIDRLKRTIPERPNMSAYLFSYVMSGKFEIADNRQIKQLIRAKALKLKKGKDFVDTDYDRWTKGAVEETTIKLPVEELFIMPKEYYEVWEKYEEEKAIVDERVAEIQSNLDGLITRLRLMSDKLLQNIVDEVDDLGTLSLKDDSLNVLRVGTDRQLGAASKEETKKLK